MNPQEAFDAAKSYVDQALDDLVEDSADVINQKIQAALAPLTDRIEALEALLPSERAMEKPRVRVPAGRQRDDGNE